MILNLPLLLDQQKNGSEGIADMFMKRGLLINLKRGRSR